MSVGDTSEQSTLVLGDTSEQDGGIVWFMSINSYRNHVFFAQHCIPSS